MARLVALLAAAVLAFGLGACGDDGGAEPGTSQEATVVLDFQPNAVHAPIYLARDTGLLAEAGVELEVRAPGASTDAPKLLQAGRVDFAILDIQDLAIARERGFDLVAVAPVVDRPLAAVIARGDRGNLAGARVGVTGLPSDDAVLDTVLAGQGLAPDDVERVTIGFQAVAALAAGRVDATTAFRNSEAVELHRRGVPIEVLPVERFGAPAYPELVLTVRRETLESDPELIDAVVGAIGEGADETRADPGAALDALLVAHPALDRDSQEAQLHTVLDALNGEFDRKTLEAWARWAAANGIVKKPPNIDTAFQPH